MEAALGVAESSGPHAASNRATALRAIAPVLIVNASIPSVAPAHRDNKRRSTCPHQGTRYHTPVTTACMLVEPLGIGPTAALDNRDAATAEHPSVISRSGPMKISVQSLRRANETPQRQRH